MENTSGPSKSEQRLALALDAAQLGVWEWNVTTRQVQHFGRTNELLGRSIPDEPTDLDDVTRLTIHPDDIPHVVASLETAAAEKTDYFCQFRAQRADGREVWIASRGTPRLGEDGRVEAIIGIASDVTEKKRLEEEVASQSRALRESEREFRCLIDGIPQIAWTTDASGRAVWFNRRWYELTQSTLEASQGAGWKNRVRPDHRDETLRRFEAARKNGLPFELTVPLQAASGSYHWFLLTGVPARDADGRLARWFVTGTNVDAERAQRESLVRRTTELESILSNLPFGLAFFDRERRYVRINRTLAAINGFSEEAHLGKTPREVLGAAGDFIEPVLDQVFREKRPVTFELKAESPGKPEGVRDWLSGFYLVSDEPGGETVGVYVIDITALRQAEEALRRNREMLSAIVENTPAAVFLKDKDDRIILENRAARSLVGETLGKRFEEVGQPDALADAIVENDRRVRASGAPLENEEEIVDLSGKRRVFHVVKFPVRFSDEDCGIGGVGIDISELKKMQNELSRSNEELKRFAVLASHDLKEPLRTTATYVQLLKRRCLKVFEDEDVCLYVGKVVDGVQRMYGLIEDMLRYTQIGSAPLAIERVALEDVLGGVIADLKAAIDESGAVVAIPEVLPVVCGDRRQLQQVFQNLLSNAIRYRGNEPPRVTLRVKERAHDWLVSVADNGRGIAAEDREKAFVLFQRLRGNDRTGGTGIGLAVCKRVVERHGGTIWVESEPGTGSNFLFTLPMNPATGEPPVSAAWV